MHTVCDIADDLWRAARQKLATRRNFFSNLAAITNFLIFPSWQDLLQTLAFAKPPPVPPDSPRPFLRRLLIRAHQNIPSRADGPSTDGGPAAKGR